MEILRQHHGDEIDAIFKVAVGGGGLIAGIAAYIQIPLSAASRSSSAWESLEDAAGMARIAAGGQTRVTLGAGRDVLAGRRSRQYGASAKRPCVSRVSMSMKSSW